MYSYSTVISPEVLSLETYNWNSIFVYGLGVVTQHLCSRVIAFTLFLLLCESHSYWRLSIFFISLFVNFYYPKIEEDLEGIYLLPSRRFDEAHNCDL